MTNAYEETLYFEDVKVGDGSPEVVIEDLDRTDFVQYVGAAGEFAPFHYDEPYAKEAGYDSVFAVGMHTVGFATHMVGDWFGLLNVEQFRTRMTEQVWPGDTLTISGTVTDTYTDDGTGYVEAEFAVENQDGEAVVTGDCTASLPSRADD